MKPIHGVMSRGDNVPEGTTFRPGKFGRMFPELPPFRPGRDRLVALGLAMRDDPPAAPERDNVSVPAGYTYLGQFVDHDITFDVTPLTDAEVDPLATENFRSPRLDLDCLYGLGPAAQPYLYARASGGTRFLIGRTRPSRDTEGRPPLTARDGDLPRGCEGRRVIGETCTGPHDPTADPGKIDEGFALIGDPRNDENLIVAQLHLAFLKAHNALAERASTGNGTASAFERARRLLTWHYQWIVLHDFLPRVIDPGVLSEVLVGGRKYFRFDAYPFVPVEFSAAAYRFGHSMVRERYQYNRVFHDGRGALAPATLALLFRFSGLSGGDVPVPSNWIIDWRRFFDGLPKAPDPLTGFNASRAIDPLIVGALHQLPGQGDEPERRSLPVRNLLRGQSMGLPSGQAVARHMQLPVLSPRDLATGRDGAEAQAQGLTAETPLWYYLLKEAEVVEAGRRLGPVGSRILAEVFVGLLQGDPASFLAVEPRWRPTLPAATGGHYTMADLVTLAGDLNPLGD